MRTSAQATATRPVVVATPTNEFYSRMAYACLAVAIIGFAPTYWIPLVTGRIDVAPILHLHAFVFYGWLTLLVVQSRLVATRQITRHRAFGVLGVSWATAMCCVGIAAAVNSIKQSDVAGFGDAARAFSVVPITGIFFFAALFAIALIKVKRTDVHKRLILIATISLLNAAVGRLFILAIGATPPSATVAPPPVLVTIPAGLIADLLLVPALLHDRKHLGHVHPAYWIGGAALLASQFLRVPISHTAAWHRIAQGFVDLL
ncbi:MAG: hypothetical protein ABI634_07350 [Acidobacteriota bacterium]